MPRRGFLVLAIALSVAGTQVPQFRTNYPPLPPTPARALSPTPICAVVGSASVGQHFTVFECDPLVAPVQKFRWRGTSQISLLSSPSLCITVGKDVDPDSGTRAFELQPCADGDVDQVKHLRDFEMHAC